MKHNGSKSDFTTQRNKELMRTFKRILAENHFNDLRKLYQQVAESPCSRFWVSEERAKVVISAMLKGQYPLDSVKDTKRDMYLEIFKRVLAIRKDDPDVSIQDAVFDAVNSPAPKFYLTPDSVLQIIWRCRKGYYEYHTNHHAKKEPR